MDGQRGNERFRLWTIKHPSVESEDTVDEGRHSLSDEQYVSFNGKFLACAEVAMVGRFNGPTEHDFTALKHCSYMPWTVHHKFCLRHELTLDFCANCHVAITSLLTRMVPVGVNTRNLRL